jgi:hypothetical protein
LERQSDGWGCLALVGAIGFGGSAATFLLLGAALSGWLAWSIQLIAAYLRRLAPQSADTWLAVILLASAIIIFFSARWRALMDDRTLWGDTRAGNVIGFAHLVVATFSRVGMTLLAGSFLPFTLFAPVYVLTQWRGLSAEALAWLRSVLPPAWGFVADWLPFALLAAAPFVLINWKQRKPRPLWIALLFIGCAYLALTWLVGEYEVSTGFFGPAWPFTQAARIGGGGGIRGLLGSIYLIGVAALWDALFQLLNAARPVGLGAVYLVLGTAYPLGLSYVIARLFYLPYAVFRNTLGHVLARSRLRLRITRTLDATLRRNKQQVHGDGWSTVCADHLRRFDTRRVRRSYFRSAVHHLCPVCCLDSRVYNDVRCVSVLLDETMTDAVCQKTHTLYLNGLRWADGAGGAAVAHAPFESLVIGPVDRFDVEAFVVHCQKEPILQEAMRTAPCYVVSGHSLPDNLANMLMPKVAALRPGFSLTDDAVPCRSGLRERETAKQIARRGLSWLLALLLLGALLIALYVGLRWVLLVLLS